MVRQLLDVVHQAEQLLLRVDFLLSAYPTTEQGLQALNAKPPGVNKWQGPYLQTSGPGSK